MPRKKRLIIAGEVHLIMSRGIDGMVLFRDDDDREKMCSLFGNVFLEGACLCYAWVLMDNHYHLVIRPLNQPLQRLMRRINGSYAKYFNGKYNRRGYVFQDRFKSVSTQEYWYLRELIRYVHLNPLRAGIVKDLQELTGYKWSGHREILRLEKSSWFSCGEVLGRFGKGKDDARKAYVEWLAAGIGVETNGWEVDVPPLTSGVPNGTNDEVKSDASLVRKSILTHRGDIGNNSGLNSDRPDLSTLFEKVCKEHDTNVSFARSRGRLDKRSLVKSTFCKHAVFEYGYTSNDVAEFLGVNASSVCRMIHKEVVNQ